MLLIRTFIGASSIHGNGVFAVEEIARGTVVWRYEPIFDRIISDQELAGMPDAFCDYVDMYAYRSSDIGGRLLLPCDHAKFLNHSADPNTIELHLESIASRKIQRGEEITCDYSKFCVDWTGFDQSLSTIKENLPHKNLYTRLEACSNGVGVFAIRDIPEATKLFVGEIGETVQLLVSDIERLEDAELRRMYYDFCPVKDGCFIAPVDFNQMAMGWYLNHSDNPNVKVDDRLQFAAARLIRTGEEVTANYTTYSQHAGRHIRDWKP